MLLLSQNMCVTLTNSPQVKFKQDIIPRAVDIDTKCTGVLTLFQLLDVYLFMRICVFSSK